MPPQSRGEASRSPSSTSSDGLHTPVRTFVDKIPPPVPSDPAPTTPTRVKDVLDEEDTTPTLARARLNPGDDDEDEEEEEDDDHEGEPKSEDDDDFESHYSRHSSPAESDDGSEDGSEDGDVVEIQSMVNGGSAHLHRVSSLPATIPPTGQTSAIHTSHSTTSLPRAPPPIPPPLYPPFYNRPPTPLPPSPSLTSLLRPPSLLNRSTTSTRPTSPDSSDVETPNDTEAAVAHSARKAHPLPPTSPKVPTYEYYGFVLYLTSTLVFLIYIFWSYLPSPFLHAIGITYYPNRWWSLAIPAWIVMLLIYIYVALACWNVEYLTLSFSRVETIVDEAGNVAVLDEQGRVRKGGSKRLEWETDERRKRDKYGGSWNKRPKGSGRKKDHRKRHRDEIEPPRFGYMGEVFDGMVASGSRWRQVWNEGTDAVMDIPIGGVCEVLYGEGRDGP